MKLRMFIITFNPVKQYPVNLKVLTIIDLSGFLPQKFVTLYVKNIMQDLIIVRYNCATYTTS